MDLSASFWDDQYKSHTTGWDLGKVSPPLKAYFDQLTDTPTKILIPGGGNSYEAEYLHHKGFNNVFVVDLSKTALGNIKKRVPSFPSSHLIQKNFFELDLTFDLIFEQTFFCAIDPKLRALYAQKMAELLNPNGKLVGLLFDDPLNRDHPPFGGNKLEYLGYFEPYFDIQTMEQAYNSHPKRAGRELFINLKKKGPSI